MAGDARVGDLSPALPASIQRAEPESTGEAPREPAELPPVDVSSPEVLELADRTAEEINDVVTPDWEKVRGGTALDALLMANKVEQILRDTFEVGHGAGQQLREADAPVLQYLVGQYPDLRTRLVILRDRAGERNTLRIGKYLGIQMAETKRFAYEIHMIGASAGKKVSKSPKPRSRSGTSKRASRSGPPATSLWVLASESGWRPVARVRTLDGTVDTPEYWEPGTSRERWTSWARRHGRWRLGVGGRDLPRRW